MHAGDEERGASNRDPVKVSVLWVAIPLIYIGLPLAILFGFIDFDHKFYALTIGGMITYAVFRVAGASNSSLGITLVDWRRAMLRVAPLTILLVAAAVALYAVDYSRTNPTEDWLFFLFYIFISCPIQEFLYRGALTRFGEEIRLPPWGVTLLTSALYGFVHIIYLDIFTVVATFLIGLYWWWAYSGARSLVGVSVSHAVLGVVTITAGLID